MPDTQPNLVFIMTDHQRTDSIGMAQAGHAVTPNLNRLTTEATYFARTYNACPLCVPTRTALATGQYPTRNGVVFNDWQGRRAGDHLTIHEHLADTGYQVAHIGVDHIRLSPSLQERVPFSAWVDNNSYAAYQEAHGIHETRDKVLPFKRAITENQEGAQVPVNYSNTRVATWPYPVEHFKDNYFCDQAIDFLQNQADGKTPFALFLYLWAPHPPLRVPEPYASLFAPDELELPPNVGQLARGEPANRRQGIAAQLAESIPLDQWRRVWAAHLGLVRLADDAIGRVLAALHNSGREKETVTVFTVDHGDHLGQHTMYQKMEMYEQAIRVPWMIRVPDLSARRFELPVSQLDILPTLTDLLNVGWDGPPPDGLSLAASIQEGASLPERPVFCQYSGNPTVGDIRRAVITSRYKYIFDPDAPAELYDLVRDPLEMENVAGDPDYAEMLQRLHAIGREWAESHGDWVQFGEAPVTA